MSSSAQVTRLLRDYCQGRREALDELLPLIYRELHRLARRQRRSQHAGHTLDTTALVHEAYLKLVKHQDPSWKNRRQFFWVAARAMRHILVDYAKQQRAAKRGGGKARVSLDQHAEDGLGERLLLSEERTEEVLALDEALERLSAFDERLSQIVELRYFAGLTIPETADALGCSPATVKRDWTTARAWLYRELSGGLPRDEP